MPTVNEIDAVLPQTQCTECGYPGCKPYAQALANGAAEINLCPPGGQKTLHDLAQLLGKDARPFEAEMQEKQRPPAVARIREEECIGCTKCIQACPVDAIIGTAKHMHAVVPHECTGCELCIAPCPVDCIDLHPIPEDAYDRDEARQRFERRQTRILRQQQAQERSYQEKRKLAQQSDDVQADKAAKRAYILEALQRVKDKKHE